ncbi:MAG: glycosyltransferase family 4 protein [Bacteroidia bacterium]
MVIIHIVLGKANPERMNGVNKVVFQLASRQTEAGKDVQLWGITDNLDHNYGERNFKTRLFKKSKNKFGISTELKEAIIHEKDAVFHLHGGWISTFWAISKVLKKYNKRSTLTPHGAYNSIAMAKNNTVKRAYFKLFERPMLNAIDKIHCIGKSEKTGLESIFPNDKQVLLPYGFETSQVPSSSTQNEDFIIGFVGRIDIYTKGLDLLVQAFSSFSEGKNVQLWIVGDSEELTDLKNTVSTLKCKNEITFFGSQFGDDKNRLIEQMNVFVHPSRNEGLPTAVLEAASFGVPSIVSEATNLAEYVTKHNAGQAIENENSSQLADAFEKLYQTWKSTDLKEYEKNTASMLFEEFNWDKLIPRYDELYA